MEPQIQVKFNLINEKAELQYYNFYFFSIISKTILKF